MPGSPNSNNEARSLEPTNVPMTGRDLTPSARISPTPRFTARLWSLVKWATFALVLTFVARHGWTLWRDVDTQKLQLSWAWLGLAMLVSILSWLPSAWYWRRLISALGPTPPWPETLRAYYCGHLGKYVPGKAMALVVRSGMLQSTGVAPAVAAFSATIETLTYMAAGTAISLILLPNLLSRIQVFESLVGPLQEPLWRGLFTVLVLASAVASLIFLSRMTLRLAGRVKGRLPSVGALDRPLPSAVVARGFVVYLGAWWLQGLVLGLTLRGLSPADMSLSQWAAWTGASAVSIVGGFLAVFAPGGLGVREVLLMELLRGQVGSHEAVAAAVVLRGVSLVGEVLASAILCAVVRPRPAAQGVPGHTGPMV